MIKNIFTIRHGKAEQRLNPDIGKTHINTEIPLTPLDSKPTNKCDQFIASICINQKWQDCGLKIIGAE